MAADPTFGLQRRFTVEEYEFMGQTGLLGPDERVELLDGVIAQMSPMGPGHAAAVAALLTSLITHLGGRATVFGQSPLRLFPSSEPEPDVMVARYRRDFYRGSHPTTEDVSLVVEVSDSSLRADRAIKLPIYARHGIVEVWLVDLAGDLVHVHTDPDGDSYREVRTARRGETIKPTAIGDLEINVTDILGE